MPTTERVLLGFSKIRKGPKETFRPNQLLMEFTAAR